MGYKGPHPYPGGNLDQTLCFCHRFLNPLEHYYGPGIESPSLQHSCHVCNIQLNSCRQAKIHAEGKKHEKRLSYLRVCMASTGEPSSTVPAPATNSYTTAITQSYSRGPSSVQVTPQTHLSLALPPPPVPSAASTAYVYPSQAIYTPATAPPSLPPPVTTLPYQTTATYFNPQTTYTSVTTQAPTLYTPCYPEYGVAHAQPPPISLQALQAVPPPPLCFTGPPQPFLYRNVSPSLTSGFSGSGDCKSTETSSILSAASYSSLGGVPTFLSEANINSNSLGFVPSHCHTRRGFSNDVPDYVEPYSYTSSFYSHLPQCAASTSVTSTSTLHVGSSLTQPSPPNPHTYPHHSQHGTSPFCDICQMAFPTLAVLENHTKGSRHARKLKSQQAYRQLKESGTHFRHDDGPSSDMRCEVCQVSVNSSQQLQAHLTGHKHKVRAARRGVKPNQALLSSTQSTPSASSERNYSPEACAGMPANRKMRVEAVVSAPSTSGLTRRRPSAGTLPMRHGSGGCLSRHCHSTLSLSRVRSGASALSKDRSRSMNLLLIRADEAGMTTPASSSSSDDGYVDAPWPGGASPKRRVHPQVQGRPRSLSVRATSITKEEASLSIRELASSKLEPVSATAKLQGKDDKSRRKQQNKVEQHMNKQNLGHSPNNNNNNTINTSMKPVGHIKTRSLLVAPTKNDWKPRRTTSLGNALKDVPMLDVFLERLKPALYGKSTSNSNKEEIIP